MRKYKNQKSQCSYSELGHKRAISNLGLIEDSRVLDPKKILERIKSVMSLKASSNFDVISSQTPKREIFNQTYQGKKNDEFRSPSSMYSGSPSPRIVMSCGSDPNDFAPIKINNQKTLIKSI